MKIYTKKGDTGTTSLAGGERVPKNDSRVQAYGTLDELSSFIAYLRDCMDATDLALDEYRDDLKQILVTLMFSEAVFAESASERPSVADLQYLEERIDYISAQLTPLTRFTIPGGHPLISLCHICRTLCRRAERECMSASDMLQRADAKNSLSYLNRLSDYLYVLGRRLANELGIEEELWEP